MHHWQATARVTTRSTRKNRPWRSRGTTPTRPTPTRSSSVSTSAKMLPTSMRPISFWPSPASRPMRWSPSATRATRMLRPTQSRSKPSQATVHWVWTLPAATTSPTWRPTPSTPRRQPTRSTRSTTYLRSSPRPKASTCPRMRRTPRAWARSRPPTRAPFRPGPSPPVMVMASSRSTPGPARSR